MSVITSKAPNTENINCSFWIDVNHSSPPSFCADTIGIAIFQRTKNGNPVITKNHSDSELFHRVNSLLCRIVNYDTDRLYRDTSSPRGGTRSIHDGGDPTYFFGLKIYTLGIFLGQEICHVFF